MADKHFAASPRGIYRLTGGEWTRDWTSGRDGHRLPLSAHLAKSAGDLLPQD
ncbi:hypothetical protein TNCT_450781, partial [Trichonephila clavata]